MGSSGTWTGFASILALFAHLLKQVISHSATFKRICRSSAKAEILVDTWRAASKRFPTKTVVEFRDAPSKRLTYSEFGQLVDRTAGYLQSLGVESGDRVALQLTKSLEFVVLHLATLQLGAISLPLNPAFPPDELKYYVQDSGSKVLFAMETARTKIEPIVPECEELKVSRWC